MVGDLRHATPPEIKAGHRIDNNTDHITDIPIHVSPKWFVSQYFYSNLRFVHGDALFDKDGDFFRILAVQIAWEVWQSRQTEIEKLNDNHLAYIDKVIAMEFDYLEKIEEKDKRIESALSGT
ncbi:hypothetical protein FQR65_LT20737 [Abscondita terminalis]|nr:hypothetical protein FQR65_LT20737 [Abscondita terminalis]